MKLENVIQRIIDRCNLIGDCCDVYEVMMQYKAVQRLTEEEQDKLYDQIVQILGFCW